VTGKTTVDLVQAISALDFARTMALNRTKQPNISLCENAGL